jgi:signal transduction histidine kinase/ActR/RegA family two-component response regulator/HPt (histidine-containing phosphotransfer) domain-containing protein
VSEAPSRSVLAAADFIAESGRFAVAVIDASGVITECHGSLVEGIESGGTAEDAFPFLIGMEEEIEAVRAGDGGHLHLPNMNIPSADGQLRFASVFLLAGPGVDTTTVVMQDTTETSQLQRQVMQQRNDLAIARKELERVNEMLRERGEELQVARDVAEEATEAKSRFLAMMSHELRTPMNGVLGMLQLLDDGTLDEEKTGYARTARLSAEALLQIIGDVLDFSKIEAGRLDIERVPFDLPEVVESVVTLLSPRARDKGIGLTHRVDADLPAVVLGDPVRCRQILLNLIGNAIKFTDRGGVTLDVSKVGESATVLFSVQDTGIGISKEAQARLFTEYTQSDSSTTRKYGGTGLGLAISKRLVELMSGEIGLESVEGEGSRFWFSLPLEATDAVVSSGASAAAPVVEGARILIADDAEANRQVATAMLAKAGYEVRTACDGREAVAAVREHGFDLVLMDLNMPEMDGFQATAELRSSGEEVPILALTAHARRDLGDLPGFSGHVAKPVRRDALLQAVAEALGAETAAPGDGVASGAVSGFDAEALLSFREDIGAEAFPTLVETFLTGIRKRVDGVRSELDEGLLEELERSAHDIKSLSAMLGAMGLCREAEALEEAAGRGDLETARRQVSRVIDEAGTALAAVEDLLREVSAT